MYATAAATSKTSATTALCDDMLTQQHRKLRRA